MGKFVDYLIKNNALEEKYREGSIYGLTIIAEKMIVCAILIAVSVGLGKVKEGIIFAVSFMMLRQVTGGFHATTFLKCLIGSVTIFVLSLEVFANLVNNYRAIATLLCIISCICIIVCAPVNHPNLMLSQMEKGRLRFASRVVLSVEVALIVLGYIFRLKYQWHIMMAVIICAFFIIVGKLLRQEVKMNEEET